MSVPTPDPPPPNRRLRTPAWLIAVLLLLAILPYLNTLQNGFVYDDNNEVLTNPFIRSFAHVGDIFSTRILAHLGARGATNYYRPIGIFGFLVCYKLFGLLPYGFHLANVLLHALIVCLLYGLSRRMFRDPWLAFGAAAIFALHPIHTESVAWVSGVTDLDLALFYLAAFWFFVAEARPQGKRGEWAHAGMVVSFTLALLSKEQAVTLPLAATIYEHFYRVDRAGTTWRQKFSRYGALWLLLPVYVLFRIRFFGAFAPVQLTPHVSWPQAILSAFPLAAEYLGKTLWPAHLMAYYSFHKSVSLFDPRVLVGIAVLGLCAWAFGFLWQHGRRASFGFVWFFLNIAPVLNSRWLGPNVFTERYLYLPSVGFCWVAAWGIQRVWEGSGELSMGGPGARGDLPGDGGATPPRATPLPQGGKGSGGVEVGPAIKVRRIVLGSVLGVLAVLAFARIVTRNRDWRDDITYYTATLAAVPEAESLRMNLGAVYWNRMQPDDAEREWKKALAAAPDSAPLLNNLGLVAASKNRNDQAIEYFQRAMRLRPNYTDVHLNLGRLYAALGNNAQAELQLRAAVALAPLGVGARNELGAFYLHAGRLPQAEAQFQASAATVANASAFDGLGEVAAREGRMDAAEKAYRRAIGLDAFDSRGHFGLGRILALRAQTAEAVEQYRAGLGTDPRNAEALAALQRLTAGSSLTGP